MDRKAGLTPEEDEDLRRLHWFEMRGMELSDERSTLKAAIRARDRRYTVRVPRQLERVIEPTDAESPADPAD